MTIRRIRLLICLLALTACFITYAPITAQSATGETKKDAKKNAKKNAEEEVKEALPESDPKAEALLKAAWAKIDSIATQSEDALTKFAAHSSSKVDFSDVPDSYRVSKWSKAAAEGISVEAKVSWVAHDDAFSMHVLDGKKEEADKQGDKEGEKSGGRGGWGLKQIIGGAQVKIGHALPYLMGLRDFETEFKDNTFTFAEAPHKEWQVVLAWYHIKGHKFAKSYFIDDKGKGYIRYFMRLERLYTPMLEKSKGKQMVITGVTIQSAAGGLAKIIFDPKEAKKQAKEDKKAEKPYEPRFDEDIEWYGFGKRATIVGKKGEMALTVTTWVDYEKRRVPVTTTLSDYAVNDKVTEEMIKAAGFGATSEHLPPPTRRGDDAKKGSESAE